MLNLQAVTSLNVVLIIPFPHQTSRSCLLIYLWDQTQKHTYLININNLKGQTWIIVAIVIHALFTDQRLLIHPTFFGAASCIPWGDAGCRIILASTFWTRLNKQTSTSISAGFAKIKFQQYHQTQLGKNRRKRLGTPKKYYRTTQNYNIPYWYSWPLPADLSSVSSVHPQLLDREKSRSSITEWQRNH